MSYDNLEMGFEILQHLTVVVNKGIHFRIYGIVMTKIESVWEVMRLTSPSYMFNFKIHLYLSHKKDQGEDQQRQTKLSLNKKNEIKRD